MSLFTLECLMPDRACSSILPLVIVGALAGAAVPAAAQDRVFVAGYEIGAAGRFGELVGVAGGLSQPLAGGGRFALTQIMVSDLRTGASRDLPPGAWGVDVDPARPRVFIVTPLATTPPVEAVASFDVVSGSTAPIADVPACADGFGMPRRPAVHYAPGGERLFIERCAGGSVSDVPVFDLAAGVVAGPVIAGARPVGSVTLPSPDGTRLFVGVPGGFGVAGSLTAWDVVSGSVIATVTTPVATMTWDDTRQWLIAGNVPLPGANGVVSAWTRDLAALGGATLPGVGPCSVRVATSAHTGRISSHDRRVRLLRRGWDCDRGIRGEPADACGAGRSHGAYCAHLPGTGRAHRAWRAAPVPRLGGREHRLHRRENVGRVVVRARRRARAGTHGPAGAPGR